MVVMSLTCIYLSGICLVCSLPGPASYMLDVRAQTMVTAVLLSVILSGHVIASILESVENISDNISYTACNS